MAMKSRKTRVYRLGLDLGTNSLGWFIVWLEKNGKAWRPVGLGPGGVRVFPDGRDPKSGTSNAADRRDARSARRRRDRFLQRQRNLIAALIKHGLMPAYEKERKKLETLDPYELRAKALEGPLPAHHIGRALFHLNQRRGFQSNRKADKKDDEKGAIKQAAAHLKQMMDAAKSPTLGAFLWQRHQKREGVRARNTATGPKAAYDFYPTRALFKEEFDAIWSAQQPHHAAMAESARKEIYDAIFFQRDLKEVAVGKCSLCPAKEPFSKDPDGYRISWAHPLAQRFRILQEVRNLQIVETGKPSRKLTKQQGDDIVLALVQNTKYSFDKMRKLLKLPEEARFNFESERRRELKGDAVAERLSNKKLFHKIWRSYSLDRQIAIVERLLNEADEAKLIDWLQAECGVDADTAEKIADAPLPDGHSRLGLRAIRAILPYMESGLNYPDAAKAADLDHSKRPTGEILDSLPYYGKWLEDAVVGTGDIRHKKEQRFGRFPNPTVHIGLGQLRRLVNSLIDEYGPPEQIVIELARDLKISDKKKQEIESEQAKNQKKNEARKTKLIEVGINDPSGSDLLKMRLWEELGDLVKLCPFSGNPISLNQLMSHQVEIEHLIPYADSLDNRAANKTVCFAAANRLKGKMTPYEAFGRDAEWPGIIERANQLPPNKRWRFSPEARDRLNKDGRDFLDRQLMETSWLGRLAKQYLGAVCDPNAVWVVTGQHTALIRGKWGLNTLLPDHNFTDSKNRADHRHHAIDALVVAVTERSLLQRITRAYDTDRHKIEVPLPWETLRDELKTALERLTVSHKPDHGIEGKLHDETAYGFVKNPNEEEGENLVYRKPLTNLTENEIDRIRDRRLRDMIRTFVDGEKQNGTALLDALKKFKDEVRDPHIKHGLRRVRLLKSKKPEYLLQLRHGQESKPYKAYAADSNLFIDIFEAEDGEWRGEAITVFQANQNNGDVVRWKSDFPNAKAIMRVYKNDLVRIEHEGASKIARVVRLEPSQNRIRLVEHQETGDLQKRHDSDDDPFRWIFGQYDRLKQWKAVPVRVDELGRVWRIEPRSLTTK
jgi:CRISPR-associated endonuclease Csn1